MLMQIQTGETRVGTITPLYIFPADTGTAVVSIRSVVGNAYGEVNETRMIKHHIPLPYSVVTDALNRAAEAGIGIADFSNHGIEELRRLYKVENLTPQMPAWKDILPATTKLIRPR